ncbi:MAG: hypothetical protein HYX78_00030 [Armatimonadetes bacterium]|nr:hypothetical protein [Armatimonadota bacterium]
MRQRVFMSGLGALAMAALIVGLLTSQVAAQELPGVFPESTATIVLTDSGLGISPEQLNPGPVVFTIQNESSRARGLYVTGNDLVGSPIIRYSMRIMPGSSATMNFFLYQGETYTFRDFTSRSIVGGEMVFRSAYSARKTIPTLVPIGRGPQFESQSATITITSTGLEISPAALDFGPTTFTVINQTNSSRGVVITGLDRAGSPIIRYSPRIAPRSSRKMNFWLYEGQSYLFRDYTSRFVVDGELRFRSMFSTRLDIPAGGPAVF